MAFAEQLASGTRGEAGEDICSRSRLPFLTPSGLGCNLNTQTADRWNSIVKLD
jgi:hypothetical protein